MAKSKKSKKNTPAKQIFVTQAYGELTVYKTAKEAFENCANIVSVYDFVKRQQLVVKVEDL